MNQCAAHVPVDSLFHQATCPSSGYFGQNVCQETEGSYMKHREGRDLLSALHSSIGQSWRVGRALCALCEEKQCLFPTESISKPYGCGLLRWVEPPGPGWVDWVTLPFGPRVEMDIARCTEIKRRPIGRPIGCGPSVRPMARLTTRAPRSNPEKVRPLDLPVRAEEILATKQKMVLEKAEEEDPSQVDERMTTKRESRRSL